MPSDELNYAAITVDTSTCIAAGLSFEHGLLKQLEQFRTGSVKFVVSEIVVREIKKHLLERVAESRTKLIGAMKSTKSHFGQPVDSPEVAAKRLIGDRTDREVVEERVGGFLARSGAEIIPATHFEPADLINRYFELAPPFEAAKDKMAEFPDAIALLSLEKWATASGVRLLAVSGDKGWADFAADSDSVDAVQDLAIALSQFQPHHEARKIAEALKQLVEQNYQSDILDEMTSMIIETTNDADADVAFHSSVHAEPDITEVHYHDHRYATDSAGHPLVDIVRIDKQSLTVRLRVEISFTTTAWFNMFAWDSIDKEYIPIGTSRSSGSGSTTADLLVSLFGDLSGGIESMSVGELSLDLDLPIIDVGEVQPSA